MTQGLLPAETSRFDVVAAYYLIAKDWYSSGGSKGYRKLCQALKHLGGNLDALEHDEIARMHAAALLWKRRREIRRWW